MIDRERYENDGDVNYTRAERDDVDASVKAVDEARDVFITACADAATRYTQAVASANSRFISKFSQNFVEDVRATITDAANDHLDGEELDRANLIVERGYD